MWLMAAIAILLSISHSESAPSVPALFVFGDSLMDPGNNNDLLTLAKANYFPYGIDFSIGPTGRYCNGGTVVDHFGNLLGLPLIHPFNNPSTTGSIILKGVNYASAGSGILWDTGLVFGDVFAMDEQIQNFNSTLEELSLLLGNETADLIARSLFFICIGANDYINNYLHPLQRKDRRFPPAAFAQLLIQEYRRQIKEIYDLGARRFFIAGIPPIGCIPQQIGNSNESRGECIGSSNLLAEGFNSRAEDLVLESNAMLPGSSFVFWDNYKLISNIINNYSAYGFKYQNKACCGGGRLKGQIMCLPLLPLECRNRSEYIFWDPYHPTDTLNAIAAKDAYQLFIRSQSRFGNKKLRSNQCSLCY